MEPAVGQIAPPRPRSPFERTRGFAEVLGGDDLRVTRVLSFVRATTGVSASWALCVAAIGEGRAAARSVEANFEITLVERLLSGHALNTEPTRAARDLQARDMGEARVNLGWLDVGDHATLAASPSEDLSGSASWRTRGRRSKLEDRRSGHVEPARTRRLTAVRGSVKWTFIIEDRELGDPRMRAVRWDSGLDDALRLRRDGTGVSWGGGPRRAPCRHRAALRSMGGSTVAAAGHGAGEVAAVRGRDREGVLGLATSDRGLDPKADGRFGNLWMTTARTDREGAEIGRAAWRGERGRSVRPRGED